LGFDGKPVAGATVSFTGQGQPQWQSRDAKSGSNGHFSFDGVCEGPVTVQARSNNLQGNGYLQGNVPAQGGDTNVVVRLGVNLVNLSGSGPPPKPPRRISGTVRDPAGAPAAGVALLLWPIHGGQRIEGQTDTGGRYEFNWQAQPGGEDGDLLMARDLERGLAAIQPVDPKTTNLDLSLQEGLTLSTHALDSDGRPVSGVVATVTLWGPAPPIGNSGGTVGITLNPQDIKTDLQGRLRLTGLPQGKKYTLRFEAAGYTSSALNVEAEETQTNLLQLPPVVLGQTDRNVAGMVLGADGKPAAGIELMLFRPGLFKKTTSDSTGHFAFDELSLGPVTIEFHPDNFNSIPPAYRGDAQSEGGGMASYGSSFSGTPYLYYNGSAEAMGGDTNVVIQLHVNTNRFAPPVSVTTSGTVFDPSGAPAPGVLVSMPPLANSSRPIQTDPAG
jgi:hypothetical protein